MVGFIASWNVNGLRAALRKGFTTSVTGLDPDIICLQETKLSQNGVDMDLRDYHLYLNNAERKGYAGTAVLTKEEPLHFSKGMGMRKHDSEGRVITLEFDKFFLVNVYTPNAGRDLVRLSYRQAWDKDFRSFIRKLDSKKPVVVCGDMNVAHEKRDIARPDDNHRNAGFTDEERDGFSEHLAAGLVDTFRVFTSEGGHYSWWTYRANARARNVGWRIDYVLISERLKKSLKDATIHPDIMGSDHCPVSATITL